MAEEINAAANTSENEVVLRIYEVGYHIIPTVLEENVEKVVGDIRTVIEKAGGSFIAEGAPVAVIVVHFLALLELARETLLEITQAEPYAPIYVRLAYTTAAA